ncbi:MAG: alpha/beta hydrolase [Clostridiales bacterium]|nr:alpha/beta hydrolase [Clostridiales bacterium]
MVKASLITVNNISLYYKKQGAGAPMILLHGNGETHAIFDVLAEKLSERYCVYALDSRGHGQSANAPLDYGQMAEDVAAFIKELGLEKPILYGFSDGGILGLLIAMKYPALLSQLIISGANLNPKGVKGRWRLLIKVLHAITKDPKLQLMLTQPHIAPTDLAQIQTPTLVLAGSRDVIYTAHTKEIAAHIPNAVLRILPRETHSSYVLDNQKLYDILLPFLS